MALTGICYSNQHHQHKGEFEVLGGHIITSKEDVQWKRRTSAVRV